MNVEIGTETPIFLFWEYLFQNFGIMGKGEYPLNYFMILPLPHYLPRCLLFLVIYLISDAQIFSITDHLDVHSS